MIQFDKKEDSDERFEIALKGELDTNVVEQLVKQMEPAMANAGRQIVVDFSELEFISSAGMRTLLLVSKTASSKGGRVQIVGMSDSIREVFRMTGFDQMLEIK